MCRITLHRNGTVGIAVLLVVVCALARSMIVRFFIFILHRASDGVVGRPFSGDVILCSSLSWHSSRWYLQWFSPVLALGSFAVDDDMGSSDGVVGMVAVVISWSAAVSLLLPSQ